MYLYHLLVVQHRGRRHHQRRVFRRSGSNVSPSSRSPCAVDENAGGSGGDDGGGGDGENSGATRGTREGNYSSNSNANSNSKSNSNSNSKQQQEWRSVTPPPPPSSSSSPYRRPGSSSSQSLRRSSFRETAKVVKRKLNNGTVIINKYRIICELGRGSYGSVHLCRDGDTGMVSESVKSERSWS